MRLTAVVSKDLGGLTLTTQRKEWILPAAMAAGGVLTSVLGGSAASRAAREAERKQKAMEARENAWYLRRYNQDYADTNAGQNLIRRAKEYARENWRKASGAQAVAGGTDAATAMAKEAGNKMMGDTIANIAAQDTARKDRVDDQHRQSQMQFAQMDMAREQQRAQNITTAAQGASNALMAGALAASQASTPKADLAGGSNNGVNIDSSKLYGINKVDMGIPASLQHTDDDLLARMAGQVRGKLGV